MASTVKIKRLTATGTVSTAEVNLVGGVQVIGGTALDGAILYDATAATAAKKILQVTGGTIVYLSNPIRTTDLHVVFGVGATEVLLHLV